MTIFVLPDISYILDQRGRRIPGYVETTVRIDHSPSDGFDCGKLAKLETDLADFVTERLRDAIKRTETA